MALISDKIQMKYSLHLKIIATPCLWAWSCFLPLWAQEADTTLNCNVDEVSVYAQYQATALSSCEGTLSLSTKLIADMPQVLGNVDVLRMVQTLPGVQTANEFDSGVHIMGCDNEHVIITLDGAPVFNPTHLFGIFSIFNASHLQNMEVARIPLSADAPCRLAGNVNMTSKEVFGGQSSMSAEVGLISSQGTYSLPIRENAGLVLSVRKSYLGALYSPWLKSDELNIDYEFCDFNATTNISLSNHDNVRLTLYYGNDDAYLNMTDEGSLYKLRWSNNLVAINWIHTTRNRKQVRTTAYTSAFGNKFELNFGADRISLPSSITEMGCGVHASLNVADIGAEYQYDKIEPQHVTTNSLNFESSNVAKQYTHMLSAYAQTGE